ncbi:hypothetical protein [Neisseria dentiae]|uniref:hypothetical protein n=1 Tax=Neisseria dentiae TaxID=194197 RepID=UPI003CCC5F50
MQNSNNNLVDSVEASGANRAGIFFGATSDALKQENAAVKNGTLSVDSIKSHGLNNTVQNCHAHHNRVAGILIQNQVGTRVLSNTCEYNGHEADGGTGYGICAFSNSVNVGIKVIGNTTRKTTARALIPTMHTTTKYAITEARETGSSAVQLNLAGSLCETLLLKQCVYSGRNFPTNP